MGGSASVGRMFRSRDGGAPATATRGQNTSPVNGNQQEDELIKHSANEVKVAKCIINASAERQAHLVTCIPNTPRGTEINQYPYYCPLCMEYFKDVLRTTCCGNYVCFPCCSTFIQSKGIEAYSIVDILSSCDEVSEKCSCPHCGSDNFKPTLVELTDANIRDYSNRAPAGSGSGGASGSPGSGSGSGREQQLPRGVSPVKIGDSYENLKRKMIPLQPSHPLPKANPSPDSVAVLAGAEDAADGQTEEKSKELFLPVSGGVLLPQHQQVNVPLSSRLAGGVDGAGLPLASPVAVAHVPGSASAVRTNFCDNPDAVLTSAIATATGRRVQMQMQQHAEGDEGAEAHGIADRLSRQSHIDIDSNSNSNRCQSATQSRSASARSARGDMDSGSDSHARQLEFGLDGNDDDEVEMEEVFGGVSGHDDLDHSSSSVELYIQSSGDMSRRCINSTAEVCVSSVLEKALVQHRVRSNAPSPSSGGSQCVTTNKYNYASVAAEKCISSVLQSALNQQQPRYNPSLNVNGRRGLVSQ